MYEKWFKANLIVQSRCECIRAKHAGTQSMQGFQSLDWPFARFDFQTLVITQSITESTTSHSLRPKRVESGPTGLLAANDEKIASKRWLPGGSYKQSQHIFCSPTHRKRNYSVNNSPVSLPHPFHIQLCKIACNADKWNAAKKLKAGVQHRMT